MLYSRRGGHVERYEPVKVGHALACRFVGISHATVGINYRAFNSFISVAIREELYTAV
jgi:hypothetical protein